MSVLHDLFAMSLPAFKKLPQGHCRGHLSLTFIKILNNFYKKLLLLLILLLLLLIDVIIIVIILIYQGSLWWVCHLFLKFSLE